MQPALPVRLGGKLGLSMTPVSRVFVLEKSQHPRAFPLLEDSEFFLMLFLLVIIISVLLV